MKTITITETKKGKGFPYLTPSVGPGTDPGVQAVSPQVTVSPVSYTHLTLPTILRV